MSKIYRKRKLPSYELIIKQTPFFFTDENGEEHFDSEDEVVQELVRCRDCKFCLIHTQWCKRLNKMTNGNWFCAAGERKEQSDE